MKEPLTVSSALERNGGTGPGFVFLRLFLALSVLFWHCFVLCRGIPWSIDFLHGPLRALVYTLVLSFFCISGFLVAGSMARLQSAPTFLTFRALRILPGLASEICVCALLLGPLVTTFTLHDYFHSPLFLGYLSNITGMLSYYLPGVFLTNPWPGYVNYSLWTIPLEMTCYLLMALLMLAGIYQERALLTVLFICSGVSFFVYGRFAPYDSSALLSNGMLISTFCAGNLFYLWRDRIRLDYRLMPIAVLAYLFTVYFAYSLSFLLGSVCINYFVLLAGLTRKPKIPVLMHADYSYGIYIYSYPLQQTIVWLFPGLRQFYWVFALSAPMAVACAMLSWHCIEYPALSLRRKIRPRPASM